MTGNSHYQDGFVPKEFRAVFAEFNNLEDVVSKITDKLVESYVKLFRVKVEFSQRIKNS